GCTAEPVTAEILDNSIKLVIDDTDPAVVTIKEAQECNNGTNTLVATGAIEILQLEANGVPIAIPNARFTFTLHEGRPLDPDATYFTNPPVTFSGTPFTGTLQDPHHVTDLSPGLYSVEIFDALSGCKTVKTFDVPYLGAEELDLMATTIIHS